jgi:hypothetical protein
VDSPRRRGQIPRPVLSGAATLTTDALVLISAALLPITVGAWRRVATTHGAAVLLGAALASLLAGTGGLELDAWRGYAAAVSGGQDFVAAGCGALLAAAWLAAGPGPWRAAAVPLTLLVGTQMQASLLSLGTLAGAAVVVALLAFGAGLGRAGAAVPVTALPSWSASDRLGLALAVLFVLLGPPIIAVLLLTAAAAWRTHVTVRTRGWWVMPTLLTALLAVLGWLLMTVAETPWVTLRAARLELPLSAAAERVVGNLWVMAVALLAGAWPGGRRGLSLRTAPLAVAFGAAGAAMVTPDGIAAWLPLATLLLVPAALIAAARRDRAGLVGAVGAVLSLHGTPLAIGAALLLLAWPVALHGGAGNPDRPDRVTLHAVRVGGLTMALGLALAPMAVLPDEVLMGTLLAAGLGLLLPAWGGTAEAR